MAVRFLIVALFVAWAAGPAAAGWLTITNDTTQPIVIQESCTVGKQVRRGKPIKLMPGETLREFQTCAGTKTLHIYDTALLFPKTLGKADIACTGDDQAFSVAVEKAAVKLIDPAKKPDAVKADAVVAKK